MPGLVALVSRREDVHVEALGCAFVRRRTDEARCDLPHCLDDETLTAAAAMILVEECRLRLDDPVDEFLPFRCPICLWSQSMGAPFCKHERRVRVARLHEGAVRNLRSLPIGATAPSSPSSRSMLSRPYLENEFAPQLHAVSLLQQFLAHTRQHLDVTKACLAVGILNIATPPSDLLRAQFLQPLTIYDWGALSAWR
jgi:hypothetical protein